MPHYELGRCLGCGTDDDGTYGWVTLNSVVIAAGYRAPHWTAVVDSQAKYISICPACLASPQGGLVRDLLTAPQTAARAAEGCEVHCVRGGPARVRMFTSELARCPVCYGRARAIRDDIAPAAPLIVRAARALAHGAGQVALAFAGDLGQVYREMTTFPERSTHDHPSGPLPALLAPDHADRTGPGLLGKRARAALGPVPGADDPEPPGIQPAEQHDRRPVRWAHLPAAFRARAGRPGPAGRAHALPDPDRPGTVPDPLPGPAPHERTPHPQNTRLTRKPEGKDD